MRCTEAAILLDDHVDGALTPLDAVALARHLDSCAHCRAAEKSLRALLAAARDLPDERAPSRDLWPGIAARLEPRASVVPFARPATRANGIHWALPLAAALMVALGTVGMRLGSRVPAERPATVETLAVATHAGLDDPVLEAAEREYARATAELLAALRAKSGDPRLAATVAAMEKDLVAVDDALARIRAAVRENPQDPALARMLASTQRRKVEALSQVLHLASSL